MFNHKIKTNERETKLLTFYVKIKEIDFNKGELKTHNTRLILIFDTKYSDLHRELYLINRVNYSRNYYKVNVKVTADAVWCNGEFDVFDSFNSVTRVMELKTITRVHASHYYFNEFVNRLQAAKNARSS